MSAVPAASRLLDRATGAAGLAVLGLALVLPGGVPPAAAWLVLPLIVVAGRRPLALPTASSESLIIGLDSSLLMVLGLTLPLQQALAVWAVSIAVGELTTRRTWDTRLFNAGVCILAGVVALAVLSLVPADERTAPAGLVAAVAAAAAYFAVDYAWSALSIALAERATLLQTLRSTGLPLALACFIGVDSLGFLAAVVLQAAPWAVVLLAVPFGALLLASHSWSQLRATEQRGAGLSRAAVALQHATSTDELERTLLELAPRLVRAPAARWADGAGEPGSLVLPFAADGPPRQLEVTGRTTGEGFTPQDVAALEMLLGVAEQGHERLRLLDELRRSAAHDPLTGLPNRRVLHAELVACLEQPAPVALLFCDLDGFKQLNDGHGHAVGDALLQAVAGRLRQVVRPQDLAARLGGDEFAVLLRDLGDDPVGDAELVAQRVCSALAQPYDLAGVPARVTASIGLRVRAPGDGPEQLLLASDQAMYVAKAAGGGRVCSGPVSLSAV